ncbi:4-hydroxy-tetrahydrodipicolinate synthase [Pleomorphochaeta sp. DL1XJH-081]|jgi:4-hydroxy-tetrahydrodipicolinate synthase|uniref:4-hydroxy-tetrahydrodipicolinate synthase n=1 Tax=Pleomorphochaeta sp. DL1XJH-081 TaxID=3409690 RepID=UPI003BB501BD
MKKFSGVYTALVTPFTKYGLVDAKAFKKIIEFQISQGIDGLVPCGTTGESPTLSHAEHDRVIATTVEVANGRVPVIAGTGSNATSEAVRLSKHAETAGVDALLLVNPYYNKPTQKGLYLHFRTIADSVGIPCILYNIKGRTGVNIETDTLVRLAKDCPNIVAVKEASGDLAQMKDVIARSPEDFAVLSGDDNIAVDLIASGGDGVISVASNLLPSHMKTMIHAALDGDIAKARAWEKNLAPFFASCFCETNPIPIKTAMAAYGWCEEEFRLPMCSLESEEHRKQIANALAPLDVIRNK